jgi:3'-phosphoadenosine 5'-phosphosulfate sulfotransferase (PAPS reductase)/FAD synthetase
MEGGLASEVVHINTGIGIEETRKFVRWTCRRMGWKLNELRPPVPYDHIVLEHGFPGPGAHRFMYIRLKERCLRAFTKERGRPITFVTGVRSSESTRRMGHVQRRMFDIHNRWTWLAPIHEFSKREVDEYLDAYSLPRNDVVAVMHMSGECLCGSFARQDELQELAQWYPVEYARIRSLEAEVEATGHPAHRWGQRPDNVNRRQMWMPLCHSCEARA